MKLSIWCLKKHNPFKIEGKNLFECQCTFNTVDYFASREDKGRPVVLKIQGRWGEIAFRVRVNGGRRTVSCWVNWIHVWDLNLQLKLEPVLMSLRFKRKRVFLVQITALCSTAEVTRQHSQRSHGNRPQLSQNLTLTAADSWHHFFSRFLAVIHLFVHITSVGDPCGTAS